MRRSSVDADNCQSNLQVRAHSEAVPDESEEQETCAECENVYIRETGRSLHHRIKEHKYASTNADLITLFHTCTRLATICRLNLNFSTRHTFLITRLHTHHYTISLHHHCIIHHYLFSCTLEFCTVQLTKTHGSKHFGNYKSVVSHEES